MSTLLLVLTLVVTAAIVLVLVGYLLAIIVTLARARASLARVVDQLSEIRHATVNVCPHAVAVNGGLGGLTQGLRAFNGHMRTILGAPASPPGGPV